MVQGQRPGLLVLEGRQCLLLQLLRVLVELNTFTAQSRAAANTNCTTFHSQTDPMKSQTQLNVLISLALNLGLSELQLEPIFKRAHSLQILGEFLLHPELLLMKSSAFSSPLPLSKFIRIFGLCFFHSFSPLSNKELFLLRSQSACTPIKLIGNTFGTLPNYSCRNFWRTTFLQFFLQSKYKKAINPLQLLTLP